MTSPELTFCLPSPDVDFEPSLRVSISPNLYGVLILGIVRNAERTKRLIEHSLLTRLRGEVGTDLIFLSGK